jgi:hypothetical protein
MRAVSLDAFIQVAALLVNRMESCLVDQVCIATQIGSVIMQSCGFSCGTNSSWIVYIMLMKTRHGARVGYSVFVLDEAGKLILTAFGV